MREQMSGLRGRDEEEYMQRLNPNKTGVAFGTLLAAWHAMWSILVAVGWAQAIVNFVFWMHMIKPVYVVGPFSFGIALC
jgi:hypothetical protein